MGRIGPQPVEGVLGAIAGLDEQRPVAPEPVEAGFSVEVEDPMASGAEWVKDRSSRRRRVEQGEQRA